MFKRQKKSQDVILVSKHKYCIDRSEAEKANFMASRLVERKSAWGRLQSMKLVVSPQNKYRQWWDYIVMFLAIYNCFLLPIEIAYEPEVLLSRAF